MTLSQGAYPEIDPRPPLRSHARHWVIPQPDGGTLVRQQLLQRGMIGALVGARCDRPLREVAAAIGTSHRMLLHHFGSREELLIAID